MPTLWIDGGWKDSQNGRQRRIENPATLELVDEVVDATAADVRRACRAAAAAQRHWRRLPALERGRMLHETAGLMRGDRARALGAADAAKAASRASRTSTRWSGARPASSTTPRSRRNSYGTSIPPTAEHQINFTIKEPLGVVAAIVPFNYPLLLLVWKIAPALAAGNTVVIKPSELTPLATLRHGRDGLAHLPPGVVNVVTGAGAEVGAALVDDPDVACIAFTGSTAVGHAHRGARRASS